MISLLNILSHPSQSPFWSSFEQLLSEENRDGWPSQESTPSTLRVCPCSSLIWRKTRPTVSKGQEGFVVKWLHPPSPSILDTCILMIPKPTGLCQSFTGAPHSRHPLSYVYQRHFRLNKLQTDLFTFQSILCLILPLPGSSTYLAAQDRNRDSLCNLPQSHPFQHQVLLILPANRATLLSHSS